MSEKRPAVNCRLGIEDLFKAKFLRFHMFPLRYALFPSLLLTSFAYASAAPNSDQCLAHPQFSPPYKSGKLIVSTYHVTREPGTTRTIDVTWPEGPRVKLPSVPPGRTDGAMQKMMFEFEGEPDKYPDFDIIVSAVDRLPLYSRLDLLARRSGTAKKKVREDGSTYFESEGLVIHQDPLGWSWKRYSYPDIPSVGGRPATWLRGEPTLDGVDAILQCEWDDEWGYTRCSITKKNEPVLYKVQISGANPAPDEIQKIELLADRFVSCLKNGFTDA